MPAGCGRQQASAESVSQSCYREASYIRYGYIDKRLPSSCQEFFQEFFLAPVHRRRLCWRRSPIYLIKQRGGIPMIPFDGKFAEDTVLPLAQAAYDSTKPPAGFVLNQTAFEILADPGQVDFQAQLARIAAAQQPQRQKMMQCMTQQPDQHHGAATDAQVRALPANHNPNLHFGWVCVDVAAQKLIVAFRGTEFLHDWLDHFDFIPAPYAPIPARGTVHHRLQLVNYSIRASLRTLVQKNAPRCKDLLITGHSLGGALCAL